MTTASLWQLLTVGRLELAHRLALSPMTRNRVNPDGTPGEHAATYYRQRASRGLLISEGTPPSEGGRGYFNTPGIHTPEQIEGWREVTDAVHEEGGHLFIQLMHAGRISHPDNTPHHRQPVGPSAISAEQGMHTAHGVEKTPVSREFPTEEIPDVIGEFRHAAASAIAAGADIDAGLADMAPLGRFALANPDVVERLRTDASLNDVDPATLYIGGATGYVSTTRPSSAPDPIHYTADR